MPWTEERLARLLTCPIYSRCATKNRRWKPGRLILRDATYWVPLIVLTLGTRIAEVLLLKRKDIRLRNGVHCLALGTGCDQSGKTESGTRIVPIPQLLLDLGFVDWFRSLGDAHGVLLFPEAARRSTSGDVTSAFGKHLRGILAHLGLADFAEDFYAMRKTFSSMLRSAEVHDGQRRAIAGHRGCSLAPSETLAVAVTLGEDGAAERITVTGKGDEPVFRFERAAQGSGAELTRAARRLKEIVAGTALALPKNASKRAAFEHLQALA